METTSKLAFIVNNPDLPKELTTIAQKVLNTERISFDEGVYLYQHADLGYLGALANYIREQKHGDNTYFNRNLQIFASMTASFVPTPD